jgi:hypothetical protein
VTVVDVLSLRSRAIEKRRGCVQGQQCSAHTLGLRAHRVGITVGIRRIIRHGQWIGANLPRPAAGHLDTNANELGIVIHLGTPPANAGVKADM